MIALFVILIPSGQTFGVAGEAIRMTRDAGPFSFRLPLRKLRASGDHEAASRASTAFFGNSTATKRSDGYR
jgi:hypothetical protein